MKRLRHPIRLVREPFGTAGLIVAMIALVAALGGTALAANGALSGKQKKEVEKIAKKFAGKPGANGANGSPGAPGAKGDSGAAGSNGGNGTSGSNGVSVTTSGASLAECPSGGIRVTSASPVSKVCNGTTGFTETLPSGKTETGTWAVGTEQAHNTYAPISFNIPLAEGLEEPQVHFVGEGETAPAGCTGGTAAEPTAEAGNLCVYVGEALHLAVGLIKNPANGEFGSAAATGTLVLAAFTESGEVFGTWAVTAE